MDFADGGTGIMGVYSGPEINEDGLVLALDAGNYKSFKGVPATNLLYSLTDTYGTIDNTDFKISYGNETVFIPSLGYKTVRYCNIYNNYPTSGVCCPSLFNYGGNVVSKNITVSPSTTYTYEIIYKVASGYTHPNYMYRYEHNGETYLTEAGVHSDANRTSLGDGWYHAWGQFTTQATTNNLWLTGMWYYQYAVYDKVSVASVSLHQGTYIIPPEHMLLPQENRGNTVATGGGWADTSGNGNNGTLENGPTYSSENGGSLVFDGVNDYVEVTNSTGFGEVSTTPTATLEIWANVSRKSGGGEKFQQLAGFRNNTNFDMFFLLLDSSGATVNTEARIRTASGIFDISVSYLSYFNTWTHIVFVANVNRTDLYFNGNLVGSNTDIVGSMGATSGNFRVGSTLFPTLGNISSTKFYNRALTAQEIQQNYLATKSRYF